MARRLFIDGKALDDKNGRWFVRWESGEASSGSPRVSLTERMAGPGDVLPPRAAFVSGTDWGIQVGVRDTNDKGVSLGIGQRLKNENAVRQRLRVGQVIKLGVKSSAGSLSQRAVVSSSIDVEELTPEFSTLTFTVRLLDGQWGKGAESVQTLDVDGSVRVLKGGSAPAKCSWRFPAGRRVVVRQNGVVVLDWHGSVPAGEVLVVDGWDWWTVSEDVTEWWIPDQLGSALNLDQHDPIWPDSKGAYLVSVEIDSKLVTPGDVWTRGQVQWL